MVQPFLVEADLPSVDDAEVLSLVKQMMEDEPMMRPVTLKQPIEVSFDELLQKRFGRCTATSKHGEEQVTYTIDWQNRSAGIWQVQLTDRLPFVTAPEVIDLVRKIVEDDLIQRGEPVEIGIGGITIRNAQQISYDPVQQKRVGRAVRSSRMGDVPIFYVVEWQAGNRQFFNVTIHDRQP